LAELGAKTEPQDLPLAFGQGGEERRDGGALFDQLVAGVLSAGEPDGLLASVVARRRLVQGVDVALGRDLERLDNLLEGSATVVCKLGRGRLTPELWLEVGDCGLDFEAALLKAPGDS
jgi:hypothetical protein